MSNQSLIHSLRHEIEAGGPIPFARFMEQALYHPEEGFYGADRAVIGRRGDYFTSVSVGPLFGQMLAGQFAEIWRRLDCPEDFVLVEQGAHHGEFAGDALAALQEDWPDAFRALRYRIVEPLERLRLRQETSLRPFAGKVEWRESQEELEPFSGVHFSNELLDSFPVHLVTATGDPGAREWRERLVDWSDEGFVFVESPITDAQLRAGLSLIPLPPSEGYVTEVHLAILAWIKTVAARLRQGAIFISDYGFLREDYYAPHRSEGSLQVYAQHRVERSPLEEIGRRDLSAHVEWTGLAETAEASGLTVAGFVDQHHFLTGLLAEIPGMAARTSRHGRALQTLLHPEFLGTRFQFLGLAKNLPHASSLGGFKFAPDARRALGLQA